MTGSTLGTGAAGEQGQAAQGRRIDVPVGRGCWWIPPDRQEEAKTSAVAQAYMQLREQILSGQLAPGTPLSEYQLATALSVSRTPIREALSRLQAIGLVRSVPQRGMFVSELGAQDIVEILEIREQLECLAVRRLVEHGVDEQLLRRWEEQTDAALEAIVAGELAESLALGCQLHDELILAAGNRRMTDILGQLGEQVWLLGLVGIRAPGRPEQALREHKELLKLLRTGDADAVEAAMRQHLRNEGRVLLESSLPAGAFDVRSADPDLLVS